MNKLGYLFTLFLMFGSMYGQNENSNAILSLNECIQIALANNPEILAAQKEIDAARGRTLQAGRIPNPEFNISWSETPTNFNIGKADEREIGIVQPIEYPGKRSSRMLAATLDEQLAAASVEQIKVRVIANVKKAYVNVQSMKMIVGSIEKQIDLLRDLHNTITDKYKTGETKYLDVLRIEVEATRLQNDFVEAKNNYFASLTELKNSIGDSVAALYEPKDTLSFSPINDGKDSLIKALMERSHTLQLARLRIDRQQSALSLAQTNYYPDFSVGLSHQRIAEQPPFDANNFNGVTTNSIGIQLGVSVPLWFWQEPQGQMEEATAQLSIAELQFRSVTQKVRNSLSIAYASVQTTEQQVRNYERILQKGLSDILTVALAQYRNNQLDLLNLFDVYRTYRTTQSEYIRSIANYRRALAELEAAAEIPME